MYLKQNNHSGICENIFQIYFEETVTPTFLEYLFDRPLYLILLITAIVLIVFLSLLYRQSVRSRNKQQRIAKELAAALQEAKDANDAKQNFFSKMSHDIRTPLNVVLGMTQIAQKYKYDTPRLENELENISAEGKYLLVLINSILDVNQLEHGHVELSLLWKFHLQRHLRSSGNPCFILYQKKKQMIHSLQEEKYFCWKTIL